MQYDAIKAALSEPFARQIGGCSQFFQRSDDQKFNPAATLSHVCLCWWSQ
jgi:hypothetical protein